MMMMVSFKKKLLLLHVVVVLVVTNNKANAAAAAAADDDGPIIIRMTKGNNTKRNASMFSLGGGPARRLLSDAATPRHEATAAAAESRSLRRRRGRENVTIEEMDAAAATTTTTTTSAPRCSAQAQLYSFIALAQYPFAVHLLDANMKVMDTLPFTTSGGSGGFPNGIATDGRLIYIAVANSDQLQIMDYTGQSPTTASTVTTKGAATAATATAGWAITPSPNYGVLGADFVNGDLALGFSGATDCVSPIVRYFDKFTGMLKTTIKLDIRKVDDCPEALAYDGKTLWMLGNTIDGYDLKNSTGGTAPLVAQLTNPAAGGVCDFQGTGMAFEAATNSLVIACILGKWFRVSIETGQVMDSGNNGLHVHGLKATNC
jgi:hypothetical protein